MSFDEVGLFFTTKPLIAGGKTRHSHRFHIQLPQFALILEVNINPVVIQCSPHSRTHKSIVSQGIKYALPPTTARWRGAAKHRNEHQNSPHIPIVKILIFLLTSASVQRVIIH